MFMYVYVCMLQICAIFLLLNSIAKINLQRALFNWLKENKAFIEIMYTLRNIETNPNVFQVHMIWDNL